MLATSPLTLMIAGKDDLEQRSGMILRTVRQSLAKNNAVYIRTLDDVSNLLFAHLTQVLGTAQDSDVPSPDEVGGPSTHRVEIASQGTVLDKFERTPLSATADEFPFHTDDYFERVPANIVLTRCVRQAPDGGLTKLAFLKQILYRLSTSSIAKLEEPVFPTYTDRKAILSSVAGQAQISFSYHVIASAIKEGATLSRSAAAAVEALLEAAESVAVTLRLAPQDILILNNRSVLHARTAFSSNSDRLLLRVKLT